MKMLGVSTAALFLYAVAAAQVPANGIMQLAFSNNKNLSCTVLETDCGTGCCPYTDATCCVDGFECCPSGTVCIPYIGLCIGLQDKSLTSTKSTSLRNIIADCPPYTTECAKDKCCLMPDAVCCSDGEHCCPKGYKCDLEHERCNKDSDNQIIRPPRRYDVIPMYQASKKSPYKSCPGGIRQCPWYTSCCLNQAGNWGCCPDPSSNLYRKANGECCDTMFGYICCPDVIPTCSYFGCY